MAVFGVILVLIFPAFSSIRTEYGEILRVSPYSVQMRENVGKMRTRITPNTDTFYVVRIFRFLKYLRMVFRMVWCLQTGFTNFSWYSFWFQGNGDHRVICQKFATCPGPVGPMSLFNEKRYTCCLQCHKNVVCPHMWPISYCQEKIDDCLKSCSNCLPLRG